MTDEDQTEDSTGAHLFVYGTLRQGCSSHELLQRLGARLVTAGYIRGLLYDLGEYPGAVEGSGGRNRVFGEVYWLPRAARAFKVLDDFEGFDPAEQAVSLFERRTTTVTLAGGGEMQAWIYWLAGARRSGRRVASGNYAKCRK